MSGPLGSSQWYKTRQFYSHTIENSLRFEDGDANYLKITQGTPTLEKKFTISAWIKLGNISAASRMIIGGYDNSTGQFPFYLRSDHKLGFYDSDGVSTYYVLYGSSLLRDPSAWYHVVLNFDSANATAANRIRIYINGNEETITGTLPLDRAAYANQSGTILQVGASNNNTSNPFEGYMAEVHFIDGSVLAPTEFAETKAGVWTPKDTSGLTFGNNGFRLKFQDSSAIGDDTSGNGNDLTPVTFASTDVVLDSPTNNFVTLNPIYAFRSGSINYFAPALLEGNLKADYSSSSGAVFAASTLFIDSGKWYAEVRSFAGFGWVGISHFTNSSSSSGYAILLEDGSKSYNGTTVSAVDTVSDGDIIGIALDLDSGTIEFFINNSSQTQRDISSFTGSGKFFGFGVYISGTDNLVQYNFGQDSSFSGAETAQGNTDGNGIGDFYYSPPSGFLALCTANLSDPGIDPNEDEEPEDYFNTLLYTGDGNSNQTIGSTSPHILQFNPGFVWIKSRSSSTGHHSLANRVIGDFFMNSNQQVNEYGFSSFNFNTNNTIDVPVSSNDYSMNTSSQTYVAWNWLAGSSTPSKTYTVKVVSDSGNKYRFDDFGTSAVTLDLQEGGTYTFDQSDSSMSSHPMKLSETANGSHSGGSTYNTGVTYQLDGSDVTESAFVSGFSSATSRKLIITVAASAPTLYYFCHYHSGMGGQINTNSTFGSSNFSGSIQSTVSENTEAGFSIVSYTGTGSAATVGHGLSQTPEWILAKQRDANSTDWYIYHSALGASAYITLNGTAVAVTSSSDPWNATAPTNSVFSVSSAASPSSSGTMIAYCFSNVEGYSKFGSYIGNGSSDGTFVYTGFKPAFIIYRETGNSNNWIMLDNKRDPDNVVGGFLYPNLTASEATGFTIVDFLSNGFKHRTTATSGNRSGGSYIYLAFAEQPFKYANAR